MRPGRDLRPLSRRCLVKEYAAVEIRTEVRIKLMEDNSGSNERLQAFCSITFDDIISISSATY